MKKFFVLINGLFGSFFFYFFPLLQRPSYQGIMEFIFGTKFEFEPARKWASEMEWTVLNISLTYVVTIFVIKYAMRDRKPYDLQQPLVIWNALLAIFSILGVIKIAPVFLKQMATKGYIS